MHAAAEASRRRATMLPVRNHARAEARKAAGIRHGLSRFAPARGVRGVHCSLRASPDHEDVQPFAEAT